ncbi:MAG: hypothetical protein JNM58_13560 [Xanthomonadaceae bacterium]|nr:hypothetical protein [Xanthomonadaceae bacterium]
MGRRERTVTAMGLPAREEAELRRLLDVVTDQTLAHWSFLEAIDADVAFCEPRSALARVYLHHRNAPGVPVCIALGGGSDDLPWPYRVALPLDAQRLQDVLDLIEVADAQQPSATNLAEAREAEARDDMGRDADGVVEPVDAIAAIAAVNSHAEGTGHAGPGQILDGMTFDPPPVAGSVLSAPGGAGSGAPDVLLIDPAPPERLAMDIDRGEVVDFGRDFLDAVCAVQVRMHGEPDGGVWRFEWGSRAFDVFFPERAYRYDGDASTEMLMAMGLSQPVGPARHLGPAEAVSARHVGHQKPLDPLLWRIGLNMPPRGTLPWARDDVRVRLRRWPDFGHLGAHRPHFAIAAHMGRAAWAAEDLARASGQDPADVRAFLNACGLCGLLDIQPGAAPAPPPEPPRRVSGLFQRLRDALGIGA